MAGTPVAQRLSRPRPQIHVPGSIVMADESLLIETPSADLSETHQAEPVSTGRTMTLNMGPQHPSTHGVLRVVLELDGENILKARPEIGYLHTGIEKQCEEEGYQQAVTLTDRVDYLANLSN